MIRSVPFILAACAIPGALAGPIDGYLQTNLVSDISGNAANTDPNLKNPWGIAESGSSPFWVADQATGLSTLYNTAGTPQALVVTVPGTTPPSGPTGMVFNGTSTVFNGDNFLFATLQGTVDGWRGALGTTAQVLFTTPGASFTGLAIGNTGGFSYLYAADNAGNHIDAFPSTGGPTLAGSFTDPSLPAGYSVYNIQDLLGNLYVTYQNTSGTGGVVDIYDLNGNLLQRLITDSSLSSPWGLAIAPNGFGPASGALLVGNKGNGMIDAYNATTGALIGTLADSSGNPIVDANLWGLQPGNGGNGGAANAVYFAAGINNQQDGLFGSVTYVTPEPATFVSISLGLAVLAALRIRTGSRTKSDL